jgi:hypothetical protein
MQSILFRQQTFYLEVYCLRTASRTAISAATTA